MPLLAFLEKAEPLTQHLFSHQTATVGMKSTLFSRIAISLVQIIPPEQI